MNITAGTYYKNIKTGDYYLVEFLASDVTDECEFDVVVYSKMEHPNHFYTRELDQFVEKFEET